MTPNGPSGPKTVLMGIIHDYMLYWTTLGPFRGPQGSLNGPNSTKMALLDPIWPILAQNHLIGPQGTLRGPVRVFGAVLAIWGTCRAILGHEGPFWCCFGSFRDPCGRLKRPQGGPIWHIIMYYASEECFMAIWGHAGTFWVMKALH